MPANDSTSAEGGLSFSLSSGKGKKQKQYTEYPVKLAGAKLQAKPCPVKNKPLAEKTIEDVLRPLTMCFDWFRNSPHE